MQTTPASATTRLASVDAYRGFVMLLMMGEVLRFCSVAKALPESGFWQFLCHHQSHVDWVGCSLHDMIQPSFSFLVGVALPFSLARRIAEGQPLLGRSLHAFWRAFLLVMLGVFLRSIDAGQTYWTFEDTLSQIGLGYGFLYLIAHTSQRAQWLSLAGILLAYWAAFALYPLPGSGFDWAAAGVSADWSQHAQGFAAHWNKNTNFARAFDTWFMNLFPRESPFTHNEGGYSTLSFIPTLGTMILGLIAGTKLRSASTAQAKVRWLAIVGLALLASGWALGLSGICPVVKRIWTPSWTLFSGGWCCLLMAGFYFVIDLAQLRRWSFPLTVVGMNSIAAYCLAHLVEGFLRSTLRTHLGAKFFKLNCGIYAPLCEGAVILLLLWLILFWMYRRKLFLRI